MKLCTNQIYYYLISAFSLSLLLSACNKTEFEKPANLNRNYFPLKEKSVIIYEVDSTVYSDFNNSTTELHFQIKDSVAQQFTDLQGDLNFRIDRYKKTSDEWSFLKVITRKIKNNRAEEVIDNRRYVRLVFPPFINRTWNGNLYNDLAEWRCRITELDSKIEINGISLDSTLTVEQNNDVNLIREDVYFETYAKNIGLVEKRVKAVDKDINSGQIKRGSAYVMRIKSYR